jgi:predicted DNA binding CopG/RHH family protein
MIKPMGERATFRLSEELLRKIEKRAEIEGRSVGDVIREVLEQEFRREK